MNSVTIHWDFQKIDPKQNLPIEHGGLGKTNPKPNL